jgi:hypothetical protein
MSKFIKGIAIAAVAVAAVVFSGGTALGALAGTVGRALLTAAVSIGISRLIAKRANTSADAGGDGGARFQLQPSTTNKIPVVYGSAFIAGSQIDGVLSTDQQTMWYVVALAEVSDDQGGGGGSYTYDYNKIYYQGKLVQFGTNGAVTGLYTNNASPSDPNAQLDTRINGYLDIYLFVNGSGANVNNNHPYTAAQILSIANGVPSSHIWGAGQQMTNCAFAIVKVKYSSDAGTTGVGDLMVNITNSITKPGDAILDYMLNDRYGCALPIDSIDTTSLTALNTYSDVLIDYIPADGNTTPPLPQQARYRINGPLNTAENCLNNLQFLVDSCDSWLQYSELTGKWRVVINKLYDGYPTVSGLYAVNSSNLLGGIQVSPINLNETYNQIEVGYPNANIKDQTDYQIIDLFDTNPELLSPNEAINRLNLTLPLVNNAVQAKYLAARRIYQSRLDLTIAFRLDYSGIQLEAGDVIRVTHEVYQWTDKLFRVNNVAEIKDESGNLYADIQAFEYSDAIYDDVVQDYVPGFNTGVKDPNVISQPTAPVFTNFTDTNATITGFNVLSNSPANGIVQFMDFNYGNSSNVLQHRLYRTIQTSDGTPFVANTTVTIPVNDLPSGNYYWSTTARNDSSGRRSNASAQFTWGGANIQPYNPISNTGGVATSQIQNNAITTALLAAGAVTAAKIALGSLVYDLFDTNSVTPTQLVDLVGFEISDGIANTVTLPVNVTARTTYLEPFYITGNDPGSNYIFPLYQGTCTTANGYYSNSTSAWTPGDADNFARFNGDWNWYTMIASSFAGNTYQPGDYVLLTTTATFVSSSNASIQLTPVTTVTTNPGEFIGTDDGTTTLNLITNQPTVYNSRLLIGATATFDGAGIMIRNITNSSNVIVAFCQMTVEKTTL